MTTTTFSQRAFLRTLLESLILLMVGVAWTAAQGTGLRDNDKDQARTASITVLSGASPSQPSSIGFSSGSYTETTAVANGVSGTEGDGRYTGVSVSPNDVQDIPQAVPPGASSSALTGPTFTKHASGLAISEDEPNYGEYSAFANPSLGPSSLTASWSPVTSPATGWVNDAFFLTENLGWVSVAYTGLFKTTNGGTSWTAVNSSYTNVNSVRFLDTSVGWAGGMSSFRRTLNGGANWGGADFTGGCFRNRTFPISSTVAWAVGACNSSGATHYRYTYNPDGSLTTSFWTLYNYVGLNDVSFIDADNGWSVGTRGFIYRITNASSATPTIVAQSSGTTNTLYGISVLDSSHAWVVGASGTILFTTDGGTTWSGQSSGTTTDLYSVHFVNALEGWVVGTGGLILSTTNGGATWGPEVSGTAADFRRVFFVGQTGFAVGASGTVLKRSSSGPSYVLSVTKAGTGSGTVTSDPAGINCGDICASAFSSGSVVTLMPTADSNSAFAGWLGACTGSGPCQLTMDADMSVTANFAPGFELSVSTSGSGTGVVISSPAGIDCGATCSAKFAMDSVVTLTPQASPDSVFITWMGACTGNGACQVTMDAAKSVNAVFNLQGIQTGYYPIIPCRVFDTRDASGGPIIIAGDSRVFTVATICGVPASALAVVANVTVINATATGEVELIAGNQLSSGTSTISVPLSRGRANNATIQLATDGAGTIKVINTTSGELHCILDVNGYFQ